ncbi:MAG: methyltransferase domain-containing protein [Bacillota bacterium]|nr:methyltransferase domain-containing protein [Bacillota bacterium]
MNDNDKMLQYYIDNAKEYAQQTVDVDMSNVMEKFIRRIPDKGSILDLGCGSGRDSKTFLEMGYKVTAIDGSMDLCKLASEYTGLSVRCLMFQDLDYDNAFEGIWACSSLHHLPRNQLKETLPKVIKALKPGGILYTCFKYGESDYDDEKERHFTCATEQSVNHLLEVVRDDIEKSEMTVWITGDNLNGRELRWVNVIMSKKVK